MSNKITIIGCGPGAADLITCRGRQAIIDSQLIFGSKRLIEEFANISKAETVVMESNYKDHFGIVKEAYKSKHVTFLVSGDPLFFSLGEMILKEFGKDHCEVIPGISSFQYGFSQVKDSWKEYQLFSIHGRGAPLKEIFQNKDQFLLLLDLKHNLQFIRDELSEDLVKQFEYLLASDLSMENESIKKISLENQEELEEIPSLSILIVKRKQ